MSGNNPSEQELINNKAALLEGMRAAITAVNKSFWPFGKKSKIDKLTKYLQDFQSSNNLDVLKKFIQEASTKRFYFPKETRSIKTLKLGFKNNNFLKDLVNSILNGTFGNQEPVTTDSISSTSNYEEQAKTESDNLDSNNEERVTTESGNLDSKNGKQVTTTSDSLTSDSVKKLVEQLKTSNPKEKIHTTKNPSLRESSPKNIIESPIKDVNPESIQSVEDMYLYIQYLKKAAIKAKLEQIFAPKIKKTNAKKETVEQQPSTEDILLIKSLLSQAKILDESGYINQINPNIIDDAAELLIANSLTNIAFVNELQIPKYLFKRIQNKAKELQLINDAYDKSLPVDEKFLEKMIEKIKSSGVALNKLEYSGKFKLTKNQFDEIIDLGLSDVEKINKICGKLIGIDPDELQNKINSGLFMSRDDLNLNVFLTNLETELNKIDWSFKKLISEREVLEKNDLKLDLKLIEKKLAKPDNAETEPPVIVQRLNPLLGGIKAGVKLKETNPDGEKNPNPLLARIKSGVKLKETKPDGEKNPNLLLAGIKSGVKLKTSSKQQNPLLASIQSGIKLKSQKNNDNKSEIKQTEEEQSFKQKSSTLENSLRKVPSKAPIDLSGKNKITINSSDANFYNFIRDYLIRNNYTINSKKIDNKYEIEIIKHEPAFAEENDYIREMQNFADAILASKYLPFDPVFKIHRYQSPFYKQIESNCGKIKIFKVEYNLNYKNRVQEFEEILNISNIMYTKENNSYTFLEKQWDQGLLTKLKKHNFFNDYFKVQDTKTVQSQIEKNLTRDKPVVAFNLCIPSQELQTKFANIFTKNFSNTPEFYLDKQKFMVINPDPIKFQQCLDDLAKDQDFYGEYIATDSKEYAEFIENKFQHRLKITIPLDEVSEEISKLFANKSNTMVKDNNHLIYYIDLSTLTSKKQTFFNLAANRNNFNIEYYDKNTKKYESIEHTQQPVTHNNNQQSLKSNKKINPTPNLFKQISEVKTSKSIKNDNLYPRQ